MNKQDLYELIDKYLAGEASKEEIDLLSRYYNSFQHSREWNTEELGEVSDMEAKIFARIQEKIQASDDEQIIGLAEESKELSDEKIVKLNRSTNFFLFTKIAIAACVIGLLSFAAWFRFEDVPKKALLGKEINKTGDTRDILPGGDKAILKLADGSTIVLDDAKNGEVAQQGNTKVIKLNGKLNYKASSTTSKVLYNTIATPRGGQYQIELADGSRVWLNAASSVRFPAAFTGKERRVEITGEAYFEVAKNTAMPFVVVAQNAEVRVIGTHFNVMAYEDEFSLKTTLFQGAVKFVKGNETRTIQPGQQTQLFKTGLLKVVDGIELDDVVAWKNGMFNFESTDIGSVARELARWYDIDVLYQSVGTDKFYARIPRSTPLADVLKLLELTGRVHFDIKGRRLIIKS